MTSLNLYYSHIKSPYSTCSDNDRDLKLIFNPPNFTVVPNNSTHTQITHIIILNKNIPVYIPIINYIPDVKMFENITSDARSPPDYKFIYPVQLDMQIQAFSCLCEEEML